MRPLPNAPWTLEVPVTEPTIAPIGGSATLEEREGLALGTHEFFEGRILEKAEVQRILRERAFKQPPAAAPAAPAETQE